jgi:mannose-6-phosphate isomerase-like protein (cupin superfamily)
VNRSAANVEQRQVLLADDGETLGFAGVMGLLKIDAPRAQQRFVAAVFPEIPARVLAAPLHRHHNEDEFTYVIEGSLGVQLGNEMITASAGTWVLKPRGQWHTFWNAAEVPCRTIEIVSPAGFQQYFRDLAQIGGDMAQLSRLNARYAIDMDFDSVPALCQRFGLQFPRLPSRSVSPPHTTPPGKDECQ